MNRGRCRLPNSSRRPSTFLGRMHRKSWWSGRNLSATTRVRTKACSSRSSTIRCRSHSPERRLLDDFGLKRRMVTRTINGGSDMRSPVVRSRNVLKKNSIRFAATLLAVLASFVGGPNAALAAAAQHHDQVPGFYRLKVGDLEVTALYDGTGVFDPQWLNGTKATMDGVVKGLQEDPHMLDVVDGGFLVNTGKQLILVDAGAGTWWGGGALGRLAGSLRSAGYTPEEVGIVLVTHLHSDHVGGLTTQDGKRVFPNADVYVAQAESDFWLSPEIAAKAPKDAQPFDQTAAAATRHQLLSKLARQDVLIAGPHMSLPALGRLRKEGSGYSWAPVVVADQSNER